MVRHEVARDTSGDIHAKGLKDNTIGLGESIVMGLASTAPAYSLAATLGFIVIAVGIQAPIAIILAFIPMLFTAIAYREMNRAVPDCGTTFTWGTKAFGPIVGWMGGWGVAIAGIIVLANLAQVAGQYLCFLFGADGLAENEAVVTATGVGFIAVMTYVSWRGIDVSARVQNVLLAVQYAALLLFVIVALVKAYGGSPPDGSVTPSLGWFNPFGFDSWSGFTEAILLGDLHLLGLGHLPRDQRGDDRQRANTWPRGRHLHRGAARDLHPRHGRRARVRRRWGHRPRASQRGDRGRRLLPAR